MRLEIGKKHDAFLKDFRRKDRRTSPAGSVTEDQHVTNGVSARALAEHGTNNLLRSVFTDNVGNGVLVERHHANLSVPNRAFQDGSVNSRALLGHSTDNALRAVRNIHIGDEVITFHKLAKPCVGSIEIFDGHIINAKLDTDSVTKSKVALQTIGISELHDELRGGDITDWRARRMGGTTTGVNQTAAMADHFHSIPFAWLPKAERLRINALALALHSHRETAQGPLRDLLEAMDAVLHMLCDDPDLDRWERERRLDSDPEWAKDYRLAHHMHRDGPVRPIPPDPADQPGPRALWSWDEEKYGAKVASVMAFKRALAESERKAEA